MHVSAETARLLSILMYRTRMTHISQRRESAFYVLIVIKKPMNNPKALAVFQEWIAANCIKDETLECYQDENIFVISKRIYGEFPVSIQVKKLSTPPQVDSGTS